MNAPLADFDLTGEVVALTGGGGILGSVFARALAQRGAQVALIETDLSKAQAVRDAINAEVGPRVQAYAADIVDIEALRALQPRIEKDLGPVTVLVNNAA